MYILSPFFLNTELIFYCMQTCRSPIWRLTIWIHELSCDSRESQRLTDLCHGLLSFLPIRFLLILCSVLQKFLSSTYQTTQIKPISSKISLKININPNCKANDNMGPELSCDNLILMILQRFPN